MAYELVPHPDFPPRGIRRVSVRWFPTRYARLLLRWHVHGVEALSVPAFSGRARGDNLWETTCFELFLKDAGSSAYAEFNFSPSGRWAAYFFPAYRQGMTDIELEPGPDISTDSGETIFVLNALVDIGLVAGTRAAGLSAVIDEKDGTRSYWALAHPAGKPDFHDPACFALPLPAPQAA
ncbi:MAG: DOMON-like domain-containing protein [Novosphingobium sp.]|nr:DOMON-like domain-containing protein [Novosphingobium sp.]